MHCIHEVCVGRTPDPRHVTEVGGDRRHIFKQIEDPLKWVKPKSKVLTFRLTSSETPAGPPSFHFDLRSPVVKRLSRSFWMGASAKSTKNENLWDYRQLNNHGLSAVYYKKQAGETAGTIQHCIYENEVIRFTFYSRINERVSLQNQILYKSDYLSLWNMLHKERDDLLQKHER